jgi:hypothetical protein
VIRVALAFVSTASVNLLPTAKHLADRSDDMNVM